MAVNRDEFFAELDALTDEEIEARLSSWNREKLLWVQEYIDLQGQSTEQTQTKRPAEQTEIGRGAKDAALVALSAAGSANTMAIAALILSVGAILAAIAAGMLAYVALTN
jgi:hypothetical protein